MNLCELRPAEGSKDKKWRRGRGHATGNGKTAGRGHKGQDSVQALAVNAVSKVVRCHFIEESLREVLSALILKNIVAINLNMLNVI